MTGHVVVTGALGHIGSRLVPDLQENLPERELVLVDDLSSRRYASLFEIPRPEYSHLVEGGILDLDLHPILEDASACIHLAAITDATRSFDQEDRVHRVNADGAERVAKACADTGTPLVFPSTTSVYGPQGDFVAEDCPESDLNPQSPYAEAKLEAERRIERLGNEANLDYTTFRFGTIFGPSVGMRFHTVVNKFCWLAIQDRPLTVWRDALDQKRPYLDLTDAVRAVSFVLENAILKGELYNAVTANLSVRDLVDVIETYVPDVEIEFVDEEIVNQHSYEVSRRKLEDTGFEFHGDLHEGVEATLRRLEPAARVDLSLGA